MASEIEQKAEEYHRLTAWPKSVEPWAISPLEMRTNIRESFKDGARALLELAEANTWPRTVNGEVVPVVELAVLREAVEGKVTE